MIIILLIAIMLFFVIFYKKFLHQCNVEYINFINKYCKNDILENSLHYYFNGIRNNELINSILYRNNVIEYNGILSDEFKAASLNSEILYLLIDLVKAFLSLIRAAILSSILPLSI